MDGFLNELCAQSDRWPEAQLGGRLRTRLGGRLSARLGGRLKGLGTSNLVGRKRIDSTFSFGIGFTLMCVCMYISVHVCVYVTSSALHLTSLARSSFSDRRLSQRQNRNQRNISSRSTSRRPPTKVPTITPALLGATEVKRSPGVTALQNQLCLCVSLICTPKPPGDEAVMLTLDGLQPEAASLDPHGIAYLTYVHALRAF